MQRNAAFAIIFGSGNFGTAETAGTADFNTFSTQTQSRLHNAFHRTAESNAAFQLLSNTVCYELSIKLRFSDFQNVQLDFGIGHSLNLSSQILNILAFFTNYNTRSCRVNCNSGFFGRAFNNNLADPGLSQFLFQEFFNFQIFMKVVGIFFIGIPTRVPSTVNSQTKTCRINFLSH